MPPANEMTIVSPEADVVMSVPPRIFSVFATGVAVPESVTKVVGTDGPETSSNGPACEIIHLTS